MGLFSGSVNHTKLSVRLPLTEFIMHLLKVHTVDAQMIQDAQRFAMDLVLSLERVLHGKIKPSETVHMKYHCLELTLLSIASDFSMVLHMDLPHCERSDSLIIARYGIYTPCPHYHNLRKMRSFYAQR